MCCSGYAGSYTRHPLVTHGDGCTPGEAAINGFKVGCNRAYRRLVLGVLEAMPQKQEQEDRIGRQRLDGCGGETARSEAPRAWHALCTGPS